MDVSEFCSLCDKPNDQILMLACVHDPCINCASVSYAEQVHIKGQNPHIYVCEVCGEETALDASTITELGSLAKSYVKFPTTPSKAPAAGARSKAVGESAPVIKRRDASPPKKVIYYCKQHPEEQISYYCFTCSVNICPQCAIHGQHKDHEVKLIKKAISQVKGDYVEVINKISTSQNEMTRYKDEFLRTIKDTNERNHREKGLVARQFENLKNSLSNKERQIIKNLDEVNKENIHILTNFLESINQHYEQLVKIKKSIDITLRKDQVLILEEYKTVKTLKEDVMQTKKKCEQISGEISHLNSELLQQQIKGIQDTVIKLKENIKKQEISTAMMHQSKSKMAQGEDG